MLAGAEEIQMNDTKETRHLKTSERYNKVFVGMMLAELKAPNRGGCYFTQISWACGIETASGTCWGSGHTKEAYGAGQGQHVNHNLSNVFLDIHQEKTAQPGISPAQKISGNPRKRHGELIFCCCTGLELKELRTDPIPELKHSHRALLTLNLLQHNTPG